MTRHFRFEGHRFDGIAVDIEWRSDVRDHAERNRRLVELSRRLRDEASGYALGAIVYPRAPRGHQAALLPNFPWGELAGSFDVWLPMAYWTEVSTAPGYREGYRYAQEGVRGLRDRLGDPSALLHLIGGVADMAAVGDVAGRPGDERHGVVGVRLSHHLPFRMGGTTRVEALVAGAMRARSTRAGDSVAASCS